MWELIGLGGYLRGVRTATEVARAEGHNATDARRVDDVERDANVCTAHQALVIQAMWETVRDHFGLTDEALQAKMREIDRRDGVADGRITPAAAPCVRCGRPVRSDRLKCMICGHDNPPRTLAS